VGWGRKISGLAKERVPNFEPVIALAVIQVLAPDDVGAARLRCNDDQAVPEGDVPSRGAVCSRQDVFEDWRIYLPRTQVGYDSARLCQTHGHLGPVGESDVELLEHLNADQPATGGPQPRQQSGCGVVLARCLKVIGVPNDVGVAEFSDDAGPRESR